MNLLRKLFNPKSRSEIKHKKSGKSKYYPEDKLPIDEKFTYNFNKNGGKFLYCENMDEIVEAFDNILLENDWYEKDVMCLNKHLKQKFKGFNLNFIDSSKSTFFLTTCESLVANNGSVLMSSNQIKEKKLNELHIPSNITAIKDFETDKEKDFMSYGSSTKNLYLLLLEDL
jgi:hypothetical protein